MAHASVEGYCCAAIAIHACQALGASYRLIFSEDMTHPNDLSFGHPDAEIQSAEQMYHLVQELGLSLGKTSIYPLLVALSSRKQVDQGLVQDALASKILMTKVGLDLHGCTKPVLTMLEQSIAPWFGGTQEHAKKILEDAKINPYLGKELKTLAHLSDEDIGRLQMVLEPMTGPVISQSYLFSKEKGNLQDMREVSMVLRACEAFGQHTTALGLCLGDKKCKERSEPLLDKYRHKVRILLELWEKRDKEKTFFYLPLQDMPVNIIKHYSDMFNHPVLFSVLQEDQHTWVLRCEDHRSLIERTAQQAKLTPQCASSYSSCKVPAQEQGKLLEYILTLLDRRKMEEAII